MKQIFNKLQELGYSKITYENNALIFKSIDCDGFKKVIFIDIEKELVSKKVYLDQKHFDYPLTFEETILVSKLISLIGEHDNE